MVSPHLTHMLSLNLFESVKRICQVWSSSVTCTDPTQWLEDHHGVQLWKFGDTWTWVALEGILLYSCKAVGSSVNGIIFKWMSRAPQLSNECLLEEAIYIVRNLQLVSWKTNMAWWRFLKNKFWCHLMHPFNLFCCCYFGSFSPHKFPHINTHSY